MANKLPFEGALNGKLVTVRHRSVAVVQEHGIGLDPAALKLMRDVSPHGYMGQVAVPNREVIKRRHTIQGDS